MERQVVLADRNFVRAFCCGVLAAMIGISVWATLDRGIFDAGAELMRHPWFVATLADAYFAFLLFYVCVVWPRSPWLARFGWLLLFLGLGSIAIAVYVLLNLRNQT